VLEVKLSLGFCGAGFYFNVYLDSVGLQWYVKSNPSIDGGMRNVVERR